MQYLLLARKSMEEQQNVSKKVPKVGEEQRTIRKEHIAPSSKVTCRIIVPEVGEEGGGRVVLFYDLVQDVAGRSAVLNLLKLLN